MSNELAQQIGKSFLENYYQAFEVKNKKITEAYTEEAEAYIEGQLLHGKSSIVDGFFDRIEKNVKRSVHFSDVLSANATDIIVLATGNIAFDNDPQMAYSECFYLKQNKTDGVYRISRQIFRLGSLIG